MLSNIIRFIKKWWFVICIVLLVLISVFWDTICSYLSNELNSIIVNFIGKIF